MAMEKIHGGAVHTRIFVEKMKEIVMKILNALSTLYVVWIIVSTLHHQTISNQAMIAAILH
jgi:hypothetical protein